MKVSSSQYAKTLLALSDTKDARGVATSFLRLIRRNRAVKRLPAILRIFGQLSDGQKGTLSFLVETATEGDAETRKGIERAAAGFFPERKLVFRYRVNPKLLGGARISSDDEMLDATVRRRLRELGSGIR